ncbi:hypothetical protein [Solibacillus sp. FSL H8-0538]|uniref:hypothetical protein n=1 Tax=Solibacillus sp. FSL H8-0538 TaxID=2921400 RepID=UPI0030F8115B
MVSVSDKTLLEFKSRFEPPLQQLPINVVSRSTAITKEDEYPVQFEFITDTYVDFKKHQVTTYITEIQGTIPGSIKISGFEIIPQHLHINCEYEILSITNNELLALLNDENPMLTYSEWLLEAIENEILVLEVKAQNSQLVDWPVGIKNAYFL